MKRFKRLAVLCLMTAFTLTTFAQEQMPTIPVDEQVRIGKLENGLTYYIRQNNYPENQVNFYIAQKVGSILEDEPQRGLAHFLEHMCFNGTEHFPGKGVIKYLESIGVKFGMDLNAYTSFDETVYNIDNVPVNVPGAIDSCLWILRDWADGLLLTPEEIDSERGVIHEEWRSRSNAMSRMCETIYPIIYQNNKYAFRSPIGLMEIVDNFPYQDLRDYYEKWYRPDQQGIVVVGNIDVDEVEAKIKAIFGPIRMPENAAERYYVGVEDNREPIVAIAKDKEQQLALTNICIKRDQVPNEVKNTLDYYVYCYAQGMANMMTGARMAEISMKPDAPFVQAEISDGNFLIAKTKAAYIGAVAHKEGMYKEGLSALYREMLRIQRFGFTPSEYERARAEYLAHLESAYTERAKISSAAYCQDYVRNFIDNEPIPGIENEYAIMTQLAPNIPVEAINNLVSQAITDTNIVVAGFFPDQEGYVYPTEEEIKQILADVAAEDIEPYVDEVSNQPLMEELPTPGKVVKTKDAKYGYKHLTLSNGVNVYLKSTDYKKDEIVMSAQSNGGQSLYSADEILDLSFINNVVSTNGVGNFSAIELSKMLAGKKAAVNPYVNIYGEGMGGYSTPKDFETMLQLTYLYFTAPRTDNEAFVSMQNRLRASLKNQEMNPIVTLQDSVDKIVYCNNPYHLRLRAEHIDKINQERVIEIYKERFANAADFDFFFTGNIDEATMIPLIEQYIGSLPATGEHEKYRDINDGFRKGRHSCVFEKKVETPAATVSLWLSGKEKYNLKNALTMNIAKQIIDIIYTEEIREKEGGTYGVGVEAGIESMPKQTSYIIIQFQTDPEHRQHLSEMAIDLLYKLAEEGPREEDLNKVREYMLKVHTENLQSNSYWSSCIESYVTRKYDRNNNFEKTLMSITGKDIQKMLKKLLKQNNQIEVSLVGVQ